MGAGPGQGLLLVGGRGLAQLRPSLCLSLCLDLQHRAGEQSSPVEQLLSPEGSQGAHVEQFLPPGWVRCLTVTQPTLLAPSDQGGKVLDHSHPDLIRSGHSDLSRAYREGRNQTGRILGRR